MSGKTSLVETGTVIYRLAEYGKEKDFVKGVTPEKIFRSILEKENLIIPGGLQAIDKNSNTISPGCCCGLERWRDWFDVTPLSTFGIFLGHDPEPWLEYIENKETLRLRADPDKSRHIDFQYEHLQKSLSEVEKDLNDFLNVLADWTTQIDKSLAKDLVAKFKKDFDI